MRAYGTLNPLHMIENPPDTVQTLLIANSSGQALDWFLSSGAAASARTANIHLARFTGISTLGAAFGFMVNLVSTHVGVPSSGSSVTTGTTAGSTGNMVPVFGSRVFQVPAWSTGYSVASISSGYVHIESWKK